ncbi:hypothetical protein [Haloferula sp.]|uniref:hypothetical protein n=1 Tax=Haloferula sp. TaxID=2497595 RepID=UPI003C73BAA7
MSIKVTKVACQSCGANLTIDESIRFVTCGYCSAQLEIVHDPSAVYSKTLDDVVKRQDAVEDELRVLRLEKSLQRIEQEWENFRIRVSSKSENGTIVEPGKAGPILFGIFATILCVFLFGFGLSERIWLIAILGVAGIALSYLITQHGLRRAKEFAHMRTRYLQKRTKLKGELASAERALRFQPMKRSGKPSKR